MNVTKPVVGLLGVSNVLANKILPERFYVAGNLGVALGIYGLGRIAGIDNAEQGLGRHSLRRGLAFGLAGAALAAMGSLAASKWPATRPLFNDARATDDDVEYQVLVRIPFGTVVLEELAFRGTLPAALDGPGRARISIESAVLFGLWHVLPTLHTLDINGVDDPDLRLKAAVAAVLATAVVGAGFDLLRLRTGSLIAPLLVHWTANAVSYAIAAQRPSTLNG